MNNCQFCLMVSCIFSSKVATDSLSIVIAMVWLVLAMLFSAAENWGAKK